MYSPEMPNSNTLYEVPYPSELRSDHASITYADSLGNTYLEPTSGHDYNFSQALIDNQLSVAKIVEVPGYDHSLLKYGAKTDMLPLASLLNASMEHGDALPDVTSALESIIELLKESQAKTGRLPYMPSIPMFAIDKASSRAELLAPFRVADDSKTLSDSLRILLDDTVVRCHGEAQRDSMIMCFTQAVERSGVGNA